MGNFYNKANTNENENSNVRACAVENGKIEYNFRHFKKEYDSIIKNLEKLKNKMNVIFTSDSIEILSKKLEGLQELVIDEDIKAAINSFTDTYKSNLKTYYDAIKETKKTYKETYTNVATFLTNYLKNQKTVPTNEQEESLKQLTDKISDIKKNWGGFNEVKDLINKICYFKIKHSKEEDRFNEINNYFDENKEEIEKHYKFENAPQLRSVINLKEQILENIKEKTDVFEGLVSIHEEYLNLYRKVIESVNSTNSEKNEIANELNEFNNVIIYHRLIRSIEERLKKIKLDKKFNKNL